MANIQGVFPRFQPDVSGGVDDVTGVPSFLFEEVGTVAIVYGSG